MTDHASHDQTLIAALAARDPELSPSGLAAAYAQLADCTDCTDLLADLVALQLAIPAARTPLRPRDFRLTAADVARLQPRGWRRLLGFIGSTRDGFSRPLALGFTTLGLAGLLVATVPSALVGSGQTGTVLSTVGASVEGGGAAAPAAAEGRDLYAMSAEPGSSNTDDGSVFSGSNQEDALASGDERTSETAGLAQDASIRDDRTGLSVLLVLAEAMLIVGIGLFGLRWSARRLGDG